MLYILKTFVYKIFLKKYTHKYKVTLMKHKSHFVYLSSDVLQMLIIVSKYCTLVVKIELYYLI